MRPIRQDTDSSQYHDLVERIRRLEQRVVLDIGRIFTALPTTDNFDGREILLNPPGTVVLWRMRYRDDGAYADAYKWDCISAQNIFINSAGGGSFGTPPSPIFTTWKNMPANRGPHWTVPFNGYYEIESSFDVMPQAASTDFRFIFGVGAADVAATGIFGHQGWTANQPTNGVTMMHVYSYSEGPLVASQDIQIAYLCNTLVANQVLAFQLHGQLHVRPVRIGP